jgi:hypothetical protein
VRSVHHAGRYVNNDRRPPSGPGGPDPKSASAGENIRASGLQNNAACRGMCSEVTSGVNAGSGHEDPYVLLVLHRVNDGDGGVHFHGYAVEIGGLVDPLLDSGEGGAVKHWISRDNL